MVSFSDSSFRDLGVVADISGNQINSVNEIYMLEKHIVEWNV